MNIMRLDVISSYVFYSGEIKNIGVLAYSVDVIDDFEIKLLLI